MKERALAAVEAPRMTATRFKPGDRLLFSIGCDAESGR